MGAEMYVCDSRAMETVESRSTKKVGRGKAVLVVVAVVTEVVRVGK